MLKKPLCLFFILFLCLFSYAYGGPLKSSLSSSTHSVSTWSNVNTITVSWTKPQASSVYGEVRGYAVLWDTSPDTNPGTAISLDANKTQVTSSALADTPPGTGIYFHIRVIYEDGSPLDWDNLGPFWIDTTPPSKPSGFTIAPGDGNLTLSWTNPNESDFSGVVIRRTTKTGDTCSYPSSPTSGDAVATVAKTASPNNSYVDTKLTNGTTYCYSLFAYDQLNNYSASTQGNGTPVSQSQQVTYPTVSSTDPAAGSTNTAITTTITISFSKDMNMATIFDAQGASTTIIIKDAQNNNVAGTWSQVTSKTVRFTPSQNLAYNTQYTVTILGGTSGVKDSQGNNFDGNGDGTAGTTDNYTFTFTTAAYEKPTVSSTSPSNNATDIDPLTAVVITFSKAMSPTSITTTTITVKEGSTDKSGSVFYNAVNKTATFTPTTFFTGGSTVTVTVKGGANGVKDENNVGMDSDHTFSFTIKNTPIIEVSPSRLDFGNTTTNSTKDMVLTVTNKGQAALKFGTVSITDGANFTVQTNNCTGDLNLNATCTITVRFAPGTSTDLKTGTLLIKSNSGRGDATTSTETRVSLSGQGVASETPSISVSVTSLEFPTTVVNQESSPKTFTIRNSGTEGSTLTINSITFQTGTDFKGTVSCKGGAAQNLPLSTATNLAFNETCTVSVVFNPKASGTKNDIITVSTNAGNKYIQLSGQAVTYYTYTLNLSSGWNLISLPYEPIDTAIGTVLGEIAGKYTIVWAYINGWKVYDPSDIKGSTLKTMESGKGYWIKMTEANKTLSVTGTPPSASLNLSEGWNLVGFNKTNQVTAASALNNITNKYTIVWAYINGWKVYDPSDIKGSTITNFLPGYGYWIKATQNTTWTIP